MWTKSYAWSFQKILPNKAPTSLKMRPNRAQMYPKKTPRELPRPPLRPEKSQEGLQEAARGPRGAPEAKEAILAIREASLGALRRPPWRSSGDAQIVLFDMNRRHWAPKWRTENQKFFQGCLMKSCKKHCFFNAKPLSTPEREHPQGGLKIGLAAPKYCYLIWIEHMRKPEK